MTFYTHDNTTGEWDSVMYKTPFCRTPPPFSKEEIVKREKIRVEAGDAAAIYNLGIYYAEGDYGFPQDMDKALELWHRAGSLVMLQLITILVIHMIWV